jgi:hypothetical protein
LHALCRAPTPPFRAAAPQDAASMVGKSMEVALIECNKGRKALTLSQKVANTHK